MMIDRREFVAGTALLSVSPHLALSATPVSPIAATANRVAFMIQGWSAPNDDESTDQYWISISPRWRTTWR